MIHRDCAAFLAGLGLAIAASGTALAGGLESDPVAEGRALAEARCAKCHAIGPEGASPLPIAPPFRELHERYPVESLAEAFAEGIATGHPAMPPFQFEPDQIGNLIAYLKSLEN